MAFEFVAGNRLKLLNSGREYFPALIADIEAAVSEIYLESYIFADDPVGDAVAAALERAARRGVLVRVLVDGFGAANFSRDFLPRLILGGVQAMLYRPEIARFKFRRHRLRRLHRKLAVIDYVIAYVGGINIVDDDNAPPGLGPRYDYAVRVEGPILAQIHHAVRRMWEVVAWVNFKHRFRITPPHLPPTHPPKGSGQRAVFLLRDNILHRNDIAEAYLDAIQRSKNEIILANAYFLPGLRFRHALRGAARRGVKVIVLLQGPTDHRLLHYATQTLYGSLLEDGIQVFEYKQSFLHAKVAVIDGEWATVGSSNIDPFSFLLAKEGNVVALDAQFAGALRHDLNEAIQQGANEIKAEDLGRIPMYSRFLRWLSYGAVRLMIGLAGYGQRHRQAPEEKAGISVPQQAE